MVKGCKVDTTNTYDFKSSYGDTDVIQTFDRAGIETETRIYLNGIELEKDDKRFVNIYTEFCSALMKEEIQ